MKEKLDQLEKKLKTLTERVVSIEDRLGLSWQDGPVMFEDEKVEEIKVVEKKVEVAKKGSVEESLGFEWFSRIGILALVVGVGFFLKYAFDTNLITHLWRILIGAGTGIAMMVGGEIFAKKDKYKEWSKRIVAGGFAITYFVVFSAYHLQGYRSAIGMSLSLNIILLSLVVAGGIFLGLKDDSRVFAGSAFFLGFVTAFLSRDAQVITLLYGLFLSIFVVIVSVYKKWNVLGIGGLVATYMLYAFSGANIMASFWLPTVFLSSYYLVYSVQALLVKDNEELASWMATLNSVVFFTFYAIVLYKFYPDFVSLFMWVLAVSSYVLYLVAMQMKCIKLRFTYLGLAVFFLTIGIPEEFTGHWITILWSIEALILVVVGMHLNVKMVRVAGYLVLILAFLKGMASDVFELRGAERTSALLTSAFVTYFLAFYMGKRKRFENLLKDDAFVVDLLFYGATVLLFTYFSQVFDAEWITVSWALLSLVLFGVGIIFRVQTLRVAAYVVMLVAFVKSFFMDAWEIEGRGRTIALLVPSSVAYLWALYMEKSRQFVKLLKEEHTIIVGLYFVGMMLVSTYIFQSFQSFWISVGWAVVALVVTVLGFVIQSRGLRLSGIVLFGVTILRVFLFDSQQLETGYRIITFIALGVILLLVSFGYNKYKDKLKDLI